MTRQAAQREAQRRNAQLNSASRHCWFVQPVDGSGWTLVKVSGLPASVLGALTTTTQAKSRPPIADDPRPSFEQNVGGGFWVG